MTYKELGKKVLEQAERPLSAKEIWERACGMGLDKELSSIGETPDRTLGSQLGEHDIPNDKKQFYVANKKGRTFFYWLKSREREFPPQETLNVKEENDTESECLNATEKQKTSF
ncbi:HrgA protein fragment 1 [Helicobacter acinonychis]|uniref:HrgA protein 1 n=1 Tax=Helicobacter acinonychis (strain Sheeba) TaxID=382638 RepID=Q17VU2_HELAH|nr:HrgA protein fragment 1 [Helicobacter acinonychis str. Sheeba]STP03236.1 HrgA protein fragment 1 [Helicobacter acinonychis]